MPVFTWAKYPFVRITVFFIIGIIVGLVWTIPVQSTTVLLAISILVFIIIRQFKSQLFLKYNYLIGLMISLIFCFLGIFSIWLADKKKENGNLYHYSGITTYKAEVIAPPEVLERSIKVKLKVLAAKDSTWRKASGIILGYFAKPSALSLTSGDVLLIEGAPDPIEGPKNPYEFNYRRYLSNNTIYHSDWVSADDWIVLDNRDKPSIKNLSNSIRHHLEEIMSSSIKDSSSLAVLKALVLGDRDNLDPEILTIYANAGVIHVLAVSGLHVGIIYIILTILLKPLRGRMVHSDWLMAVLIVITLWLYAFITGLSPSVLRAVTMFSILAIGQQLKRQASVFNSLALSAFILLWVNPYIITKVGFQLSYLAVIGIILLYPKIEKLFSPRNKFLKAIWQLLVVSVSAQIATAPLAAYYFHQLPTYFMISNLLVIPIVTVLVWGGVVFLAIGSISEFMANILGELLSLLILIMNKGLSLMSFLPMSTVKEISIDIVEVLLLYFLIGLVIAAIYRGFSNQFKVSIPMVIILLLSCTLYRTSYHYSKDEIVFYSVDNSWAIDFIDNGEYISLNDTMLSERTKNYSLKPNRVANRLALNKSSTPLQYTTSIGQVLVWRGRKILITSECYDATNAPMKFDIILIHKGRSYQDCSRDQNLLTKLVDRGLPKFSLHSLRNNGAYILDLNN